MNVLSPLRLAARPNVPTHRRVARTIVGAALAASTMTGCKKPTAPPVVVHSALADSADQVMFGMRTILTNRGVRQAELLADTAFTFEEGSRLELRVLNSTFYTSTGIKNATLTSLQGTYNSRAAVLEARGNVAVVTEDGRHLTTPQLRYDQTRNEISSDSAFTLLQPGKMISGVGFTSDPNLLNVKVLSHASAATSVQVPPK
jgi:LPS export ABC transporter protein LptC